MGKTAAHAILAARGIPVVDTDEVARAIVEPGQPALAEIVSEFGSEFLTADGKLDRRRLAERVFGERNARRRLEAILHPRIRSVWQEEVEGWRGKGLPLGVVVIPLLFETQAAGSFDRVVCVACSSNTQRERLNQRGWSESESRQRMAAQWPIERKMALSHHVVWNEGDPATHAAQWDRILAGLN